MWLLAAVLITGLKSDVSVLPLADAAAAAAAVDDGADTFASTSDAGESGELRHV